MPEDAAATPEGSPLRSLLAVVAGWIVLWIVSGLYATVLYGVDAADFPNGGAPTARGLVLTLAGALPNGILGGLITARVAGWAPIAHAGVLAGLIGFFAMLSSDAARGLPWWFAVGRAVAPAAAIVGGGAIARLMARAKKR